MITLILDSEATMHRALVERFTWKDCFGPFRRIGGCVTLGCSYTVRAVPCTQVFAFSWRSHDGFPCVRCNIFKFPGAPDMTLHYHPETLDDALEIIQVLYQNLIDDTARMHEAQELADVNQRVSEALLQSVENILGTVGQVKKIASQTKLLAINAGIEAAQAGDSGRGFLIVADEVKELSKQTSAATTNITREIQEVQQAANEAAASLKAMITKISEVKDSNHEILDMLARRR
ncbi:MAG: hypothetical protein HQL76_08475 [Magnetococcales bacterium]|nr:hypothetical protein [Magnetococcales bacterium]